MTEKKIISKDEKIQKLNEFISKNREIFDKSEIKKEMINIQFEIDAELNEDNSIIPRSLPSFLK